MINMKLFKTKKIKVYFIAQYKAGLDKFESVVKEMQKDDSFDEEMFQKIERVSEKHFGKCTCNIL